jgi:putative membrane protein
VLTGFLPLYLVQLAALIVLVPLFCWQPVVMRLAPDVLKRDCAARNAREQFFLNRLHETPERGGLLLFVSEAEHYVEIIADSGIDARVPPGAWDAIVAAFTIQVKAGKIAEGFVAAVAACGALHAEHLPLSGDNPNRLPDVLIEI